MFSRVGADSRAQLFEDTSGVARDVLSSPYISKSDLRGAAIKGGPPELVVYSLEGVCGSLLWVVFVCEEHCLPGEAEWK